MAKSSQKNEEKPSKTKTPPKKLILCELVEAYPEENWVIMGALSRAGLLEQYKHELSVYEYEDITPSITADELSKMIKDFLGE
ncbi:MAG: hypothetical protein J6M91_07855 [Methanobrevibacter sp.]|nr:hypothetical protein [Methanobrevibacter sp.]